MVNHHPPSDHYPRMKEKLAPYRLTAVWRAGVNHKVVDCLSRRPVDDPSPEDLSGENEIEHCHSVLFRLACEDAESGEDILSDGHIVSVRDKGRQDAEYSHLKQVITIGHVLSLGPHHSKTSVTSLVTQKNERKNSMQVLICTITTGANYRCMCK